MRSSFLPFFLVRVLCVRKIVEKPMNRSSLVSSLEECRVAQDQTRISHFSENFVYYFNIICTPTRQRVEHSF